MQIYCTSVAILAFFSIEIYHIFIYYSQPKAFRDKNSQGALVYCTYGACRMSSSMHHMRKRNLFANVKKQQIVDDRQESG